MNDDPTLFDSPPAARAGDPWTSHEAARSAELGRNTIAGHILDILDGIHPRAVTQEQIVYLFERRGYPASPSGIRTRVNELYRTGHIEQADFEGLTRSGRRAARWRAARDGV